MEEGLGGRRYMPMSRFNMMSLNFIFFVRLRQERQVFVDPRRHRLEISRRNNSVLLSAPVDFFLP